MTELPSLRAFPNDIHVLVQGATRGIGLALTQTLLACPQVSTLHATGRSASTSCALEDLARQHPGRLQRHDLDLVDERSIASCTQAIRTHHPHLHLVLNVSGVLHDPARGIQPEKKLEHVDPASALHAFHINALGPLLILKHVVPMLRHDERAVVANLSARVGSISDNRSGGWYTYRATKAAQNQATKSAAIEFRRRAPNAIIVALHPGTVATDLSAPFRTSIEEEKVFSPERAALQLLAVIDGLQAQDSGAFFSWSGEPIPW